MRSQILSPNASMPVKSESPTQAASKRLFEEEQQHIAPGVQTIALLSQLAIARGRGEHQSASSSPVETRARAFIEGVAAIGFAEFRRRNGSEPLSREVRAAILATLPA